MGKEGKMKKDGKSRKLTFLSAFCMRRAAVFTESPITVYLCISKKITYDNNIKTNNTIINKRKNIKKKRKKMEVVDFRYSRRLCPLLP